MRYQEMSDEFKVNYRGPWLEIRTTPGGYEYVHSVPNDGMAVAVLGYFKDGHTVSFLGRYEVCPAHGDTTALCALTGMVDKGESPLQAAVRELEEESGYKVVRGALVYMGHVRPSKASDTIIHAFACDLSGMLPSQALGDGTELEKDAYCRAVSIKEIIASKDPVLHSMALILYAHEDF
jgi:8-oxo-dGTP pyrophosphatase MutT (NUDIX family)